MNIIWAVIWAAIAIQALIVDESVSAELYVLATTVASVLFLLKHMDGK